MTKEKYSKTAYMALAALFAALTAVCSWISIPLGFTPIPMNLATLAVFLAGGFLGPKYGSVSLTVYALVGAAGAPVFAGFRGGFSVIAGPTGGFIIGYIVAAFIVGLICSRNRSIPGIVSAMILAMISCYTLGTIWFIIITHTNVPAALLSCVVPFLPGDAIKIAAGTFLLRRLSLHL
ncbi:MAG: biotin transporter BioY [Lentihominibacter sp.]|jgi:biotin transport system substrate-specific component